MIKTCEKTGQSYIDLSYLTDLDRKLSKFLRPYNRTMIRVAMFSFFASLASALMAVNH